MERRRDKPVVGLDIGSTKICTLITSDKDGELQPVGFAKVGSKGLRMGAIVDLKETIKAIQQSVAEAELMAGVEIDDVFVGLGGPHIRSFNSEGAIPLATPSREITREDIRHVIENARAVALAPDREILHIIAQEFVVDDQPGIDDPLDMVGTRLKVNVHIVTSAVTAAQNVVTAVHRSGLEVADTVLEPIAAAEAVISDDERELGCVLVDIGGATTSLAIYHHGAVRHSGVLPVGSDHLTNDIAVGLHTRIPEAERLKREFGCVKAAMAGDGVTFEFSGAGARRPQETSQRVLSEILQPRAEEIIHFVRDEIRNAGYERQCGAGVVLTGGGALQTGIPELAEDLLRLPVRLGGSARFDERYDEPGFATVVGLVAYGDRRRKSDAFHEQSGSAIKRMIGRLRSAVF